MARTKRPTRSETKKATASTPARPADDIAVALLGLKNSATKKVKKKGRKLQDGEEFVDYI